MHDSSSVINTPSDVNKSSRSKTDISREIILPAGTLMTQEILSLLLTLVMVQLIEITNNYPQATGAGYPYMTYNSGNTQYAPVKIYQVEMRVIQGTNMQPWDQGNPITTYTQSQTGGYYVSEPCHGMPFAIKRNSGSIRIDVDWSTYGWRILP